MILLLCYLLVNSCITILIWEDLFSKRIWKRMMHQVCNFRTFIILYSYCFAITHCISLQATPFTGYKVNILHFINKELLLTANIVWINYIKFWIYNFLILLVPLKYFAIQYNKSKLRSNASEHIFELFETILI